MFSKINTTTTCGCGFLHYYLQSTWDELRRKVDQLFSNIISPPLTPLKKYSKNTTVLLQDVRHHEQFGYNDDDIRKLACRVNELMKNLIEVFPKVLESPEGQETLYSTFQLASTLKSLKPFRRQIWQELSEDVQQIFNAIAPYTMPPTRDEDKCLRYCSITSLPPDSFYLSFADNCLFSARHLPDNGIDGVCFQLKDHPEVTLYGTGQYPNTEIIGKYLLDMPPGIQEVFDIESLYSEINHYNENYPSIGRSVTPQLLHQATLLKIEYLNSILESLGVPVDRPLAIAERGEWTIYPSEEIRSVSKQTSSKDNRENLEKVFDSIRLFFDLEKRYGIILMSDAPYNVDRPFIDPFAFREGERAFCSKVLSELEFIEGSIEERHNKTKKYLEKIYPANFISEIFRDTMGGGNELEAIADFLSLLAEKKFLSLEDLLKGSDAALEVLQAVMHTPCLYKNSDVIPWNKLTSLNELLIYLHLNRYVNQDSEKVKATLENIYQCAYAIIEHIPRKGRPIPAGKSFEMISEEDLELRKQLKQLVIKYLLDEFLKDPKKPLQKTLQELTDQHCDKLSKTAKSDVNLQILILNDMKVEGTRVEHIFDDRLIDTGGYFSETFWRPFIEDLNQMVFPEKIEEDILDRITLLRAANRIAKDDNAKKEIVTKTLYGVLHPHMLAYKKKRIGGEVLQRIQHHLK